MVKLDLPLVKANTTPRKAFDLMRTKNRSGIVIDLGGGAHVVARAHVIASAIKQKAANVGGIPDLEEIVHWTPGSKAEIHIDEIAPTNVTLKVTRDILPLFEQGPALCLCDKNGHPGGVEGEPCPRGCGGTVICIKSY